MVVSSSIMINYRLKVDNLFKFITYVSSNANQELNQWKGVRPLNQCYGFLMHIKRWRSEHTCSTTVFCEISVCLSVKS